MATFKKRLSTKSEKNSDKKEVLIRLRHGKNIEIYAKSHIFIHPKFFSEKEGDIVIKSRIFTDEVREANQLKSRLDTLINHIAGEFQNTPKDTATSKWMQETIDRFTWPEQYEKKEEPVRKSFFELYDIFLTSKENLSEGRRKHYKVFINILKRYELYTKEYLDLDTLTPQSIQDIADFMKKEHTFFQTTSEGVKIPKSKYKDIYSLAPETRLPGPRGDNYIRSELKMLRAFILWANNQGYTGNDPFRKYSIGAEVYGKPIYITAEERDRIYSADLSKTPTLERQRDIFIFQCLTGCRISDLYRLNKDSIGSDPRGIYIHYIPHKTIEDNPQTVKVYLNDKAQEILSKYRDKFKDTHDILPLISQQKYNDTIKEVFRACGIDRIVPVLNPVTGQTEHKSIADIASSHMARRTFVGNLYKKVKDPNLVGKLSGHKEGSRAFARYRDIDDDMIKEMTELL